MFTFTEKQLDKIVKFLSESLISNVDLSEQKHEDHFTIATYYDYFDCKLFNIFTTFFVDVISDIIISYMFRTYSVKLHMSNNFLKIIPTGVNAHFVCNYNVPRGKLPLLCFEKNSPFNIVKKNICYPDVNLIAYCMKNLCKIRIRDAEYLFNADFNDMNFSAISYDKIMSITTKYKEELCTILHLYKLFYELLV